VPASLPHPLNAGFHDARKWSIIRPISELTAQVARKPNETWGEAAFPAEPRRER